jgi:hypothetical protein
MTSSTPHHMPRPSRGACSSRLYPPWYKLFSKAVDIKRDMRVSLCFKLFLNIPMICSCVSRGLT